MKKIDEHNIDWKKVSEALKLPVHKTINMFNDGRILGRLGEFLHEESQNGVRQNENSYYDIKEKNDLRTEIRTITNKVSFASSKEVGYGRKVTDDGFKEKLNSLDRFVVIDKREILEGKLVFIEVTKDDLDSLGLGKNKSVSSKKFFKKYDGIE